MEETPLETIAGLPGKQRAFYSTGITRDIRFRKEKLKAFRNAVEKYEKRISDALWHDLHKSPEESFLTEISLVLQEIRLHLAHLEEWSAPRRVETPLHLFPSTSRILYEPLGVSLIIAPWNYPFLLLMSPLVGAISAGCCAVVKPSPYTPSVAAVMEQMIRETFSPEYITTVQGGRAVNTELLRQRWDVIFFTGSPALGKTVMRAASEHLTPVVLELGGKSPCIVDQGANLKVAASRIAWGKTINAGQTCIAPDYLLVHHSLKDELLPLIGEAFIRMYGPDIKKSRHYPRIVNQEAFNRLTRLMQHGRIVSGGETDPQERYIAPAIIDGIEKDFPVMQEEIFGPILPVLTFETTEEAISFVNSREKPLAFYYFGPNVKAGEVFRQTTSGGGCINDTIMHIVNHNLPFGGVGNSGTGKYHGLESFLAFSNQRSVVRTTPLIDLPFKYVPFRYFRLLRKILSL